MGKFELSLSESYVRDWTIVESIREYFQNAIDQQSTIRDNDMFFKYNEELETLYIGNKSSVLEVKTLLLGASTKANDDNTIGQFGEGYKIATLVAIREGKQVTFYNYGKKEVWKPRMVKSKRYGANILTFFTEKYIWKRVPDNYLTIEVKGVSKEEYIKIVESNLHLQTIENCKDTKYGQILLDSKHKGNIYVNGLFVKHLNDMDYGYDILPKYLKLDRDRKMVSSFDIQWLTSQMWGEISNISSREVVKLARENSSDIQYAHSIKVDVKEANKEYKEFLEEHGEKAVPVSSNDEIRVVQAKYENAMPVFVSKAYKEILEKSEDFKIEAEEKVAETMEDKLMIWITLVKDRIYDDEYEEFLNIIGRGKAPF